MLQVFTNSTGKTAQLSFHWPFVVAKNTEPRRYLHAVSTVCCLCKSHVAHKSIDPSHAELVLPRRGGER